MIEVKSLTKRYGSKTALDNISFSVGAGEVLGFLGPNGAGKTTTMNIITGYLSSTGGTVRVDGREILENPAAVKSRIGYLPELPPLYQDMTVREYLSFAWSLKKLKGNKGEQIAAVCAQTGVEEVMGRRIKNLSKGYRQRVGLGQALLGTPPVLILDEPTVGLDPKQIIEMRDLIRDLGKRHTILLSSHILSEVQAVCGRVLVINKGKLVADGSPADLSRSLGSGHRLHLRIAGPEQPVAALLRKLPGAVEVTALTAKEEAAADFQVQVRQGADPRRELFARLAQRGWPLLRLTTDDLSLEQVFLELTGDEAPAPETQDAKTTGKGGDA